MHKNDYYPQVLIVSVIINCRIPAYGNAVQTPPKKFITHHGIVITKLVSAGYF